MKQSENKKQVASNVAKALANVPIDNKQERDIIRSPSEKVRWVETAYIRYA